MIYLRLTVIILIFDMLINFIIKQFTINVKGDEIYNTHEVRFFSVSKEATVSGSATLRTEFFFIL